jgi:hypothetical protein
LAAWLRAGNARRSATILRSGEGLKMFESNSKKLFNNIILYPYTLKDIRLLVLLFRQEFLNSVTKILDHKKQYGLDKNQKNLTKIYDEIHHKRVLLDDLERALEVAENNDYIESERREHYLAALSESEEKDDERFQRIVDNALRDSENLSEREVLTELRKQLVELYYFIRKWREQDKRKEEWRIFGPLSRVDREFQELMKSEKAES